jgi:hypothetical protein
MGCQRPMINGHRGRQFRLRFFFVMIVLIEVTFACTFARYFILLFETDTDL